ncbi:hypothetical protein ILUMI_20673 [Ignelater luminosus]|uniref:Thioredoxin domain-containing protein n=1 Tax=Ignelater luminosus TaxID=2038154 RepID=A0A8K0G4N4_IGNLU|nr:hypothetical protein ILUMI_20673 [Ignelater luminosus]
MLKLIFYLAVFVTSLPYILAKLEVVNDEELLSLIRTEKYVIVLFTKKDCEACDNYENELTALREDIVDSLNAWVVKATSSQLVRLYSPTNEPALVFFRHGVPLLYDGLINDELILHVLTNNKEPAVKELTDETFEHLTQAATGATTGDWFVMFYTTECVDCQRLQARWEAVGAHLKSRLNVARVNKGGLGAITGRRFEIHEVPSFIFFRQGKMYRYTIRKYDVESFVSFAEEWYKNAKGEKVPLPKSTLDDFTALVMDYIRENPWLWQIGVGAFIIGLLVSFLMKRKSAKQVQKTTKKFK